MDSAIKDNEKKGFFTLFVVWISMLISLGIYVLMVFLFRERIEPVLTVQAGSVRNFLYFIVALELAIVFSVRRYFLKKIALHGDVVNAQDYSAMNPHQKSVKYKQAVLLLCVTSESIGLFGLIFFFLTTDYQSALILMGISAFSLFVSRPRIESWNSLFQPDQF